jgi:hypothetical protein
VDRKYLGIVVIHQVHFFSAGNNNEQVETCPNSVRDAGAIAIHRIGPGQGSLNDIAVEIDRLIRDEVTLPSNVDTPTATIGPTLRTSPLSTSP